MAQKKIVKYIAIGIAIVFVLTSVSTLISVPGFVNLSLKKRTTFPVARDNP